MGPIWTDESGRVLADSSGICSDVDPPKSSSGSVETVALPKRRNGNTWPSVIDWPTFADNSGVTPTVSIEPDALNRTLWLRSEETMRVVFTATDEAANAATVTREYQTEGWRVDFEK